MSTEYEIEFGVPILKRCPVCGATNKDCKPRIRFYEVTGYFNFTRGIFSSKRNVSQVQYWCWHHMKHFILELDGDMWMLVEDLATELWGGAGPDCTGKSLVCGTLNYNTQ